MLMLMLRARLTLRAWLGFRQARRPSRLLLENREVYIRAASDMVQDKITLLLEKLREVALDPEKPFVRTPQNVGLHFLTFSFYRFQQPEVWNSVFLSHIHPTSFSHPLFPTIHPLTPADHHHPPRPNNPAHPPPSHPPLHHHLNPPRPFFASHPLCHPVAPRNPHVDPIPAYANE
jgi:hypothetical protein